MKFNWRSDMNGLALLEDSSGILWVVDGEQEGSSEKRGNRGWRRGVLWGNSRYLEGRN